MENIEELGRQIQGLASIIQSRIPEPPQPKPIELGTFVRDSLEAKRREGCRDDYLKQIKSSWGQFRNHTGPQNSVHTITVAQVENWLSSDAAWKSRTRRNYLVDTRTLLAEAVRKGHALENVAKRIPKPRVDDSEKGILTLKQTWQVLWKAYELGIGQYVGVMLFAGLRPKEADRIRREDFKGEYLAVVPGKSKTRKRRLVPILPALKTWLEFCGPCQWPPVNRHRKMKAVRAVIDEWPHDALRNCFASYALAEFGAAKAARWAGHSETVLFRDYAELVTEREAQAFWTLSFQFRPKIVAKDNRQLELPLQLATPETAMLDAA